MGPTFKGQEVFEDGTDRFYRNAHTELSLYAA